MLHQISMVQLRVLTRTLLLALFLSFHLFFSSPLHANGHIAVKANISNFPPLQFEQDGVPQGYVVDIVNKTIESIQSARPDMDIELETRFIPWGRAFRDATSDMKNQLFFSVSRTHKRENLFHWLGAVSPYDVHLYSLKGKNELVDLKFNSYAELLGSSLKIGVQQKGNAEELLIRQGFQPGKDFVTYSNYNNGLNMLYRGYIDLMPMTSFLAQGNACQLGRDGTRLVSSFELGELNSSLWAVFSKNTSQQFADLFSLHLKNVVADSASNKRREQAIKKWHDRVCEK